MEGIQVKEKIYFKRPCRRCDEVFEPSGPKQRLCSKCRLKAEEDRVYKVYYAPREKNEINLNIGKSLFL